MIPELAAGARPSHASSRDPACEPTLSLIARPFIDMAITRQTVLHIAELARLRLDESEVESLKNDLSRILDYVAELGELDTSDVPPTVQMAAMSAGRPDQKRPGLAPEQALAEAPKTAQGGFAVPGFVDES